MLQGQSGMSKLYVSPPSRLFPVRARKLWPNRQELRARDFSVNQGIQSGGILCVFPALYAEEWMKKIRSRPQTIGSEFPYIHACHSALTGWQATVFYRAPSTRRTKLNRGRWTSTLSVIQVIARMQTNLRSPHSASSVLSLSQSTPNTFLPFIYIGNLNWRPLNILPFFCSSS